MKTEIIIRKLAAGAALSLFLLCIPSCELAKLKRVRVASGPVNVRVEVAVQNENVSQKNYIGTVEPAKVALLSSLHSGTLRSLPVKQGQKIKEGQVVAQVYSQTVESSYELAIASLNQARDGYERASKMYASGGIPKVKMVEVTTKLEQAKAAMEAAESSREDCYVRAPFDGEVAKTFVHSGERVVMGQELLSIIDPDGLEISIAVAENDISAVKIGEKAEIVFPALEDTRALAVVKSKDLISDPLSHTYRCNLRILSRPASLMSGMACKVYLAGDNVKGIVVPADVIKLDSEGKYLWVVQDGKAVKRRVECGGYSGHGVIVSSGLSVGDMIITAGSSKVSSGMAVNIVG